MEYVMKTANIFFCTTLMVILSSTSLSQDSESKPCSYPEAAQFDFWIGKWKVEWVDKDGVKGNGANTIKKILDGCVIEENFDGNPGTPLIGKSLSVFVPKLKKWKQTWVDNFGSYLDFTGEFTENKMVLSRELMDNEGKKIFQRMVFYNINKDSLDWNWERSLDEGKNWELLWKIHYTKLD
jgi:hypothetical protein